jgi:hypothetical protein
MVVAINSNWQIPVAFYFVNRLLAEDTANLLIQFSFYYMY